MLAAKKKLKTIEYDISNEKNLKKYFKDNHFIKAVMGPVGSGKSVASVMSLFTYACTFPPDSDNVRRTKYALIRNTYPQLNDTTLATVKRWIPEGSYPGYDVKYYEAKHIYKIKIKLEDDTIVQSEWLFRALDRPDHISNLLSLELTGAWLNEAREIPYAVFKRLIERIGRYPEKELIRKGWSGMLLDTNPPDTDSWFYKFFEEHRPDNAALFRQPSGLSKDAENKKNLPDNYYENIIASNKDNPDAINVYVHGQYGYVQDGKPVYPEYRDELHYYPKDYEPNDKLPIILGFDFGLTPACVYAQLKPDGRLIIFDENVSESIGLRTFLRDSVKPKLNRLYREFELKVVGDPAGVKRDDATETTVYDIIREELGIEGKPAHTNSIVDRLDSIKKRLTTLVDGKPAIVLSKGVPLIRKGFLGKYKMRRLKVSEDRYSDTPDKNEYSHIHDALQYVGLYTTQEIWQAKKLDERRERLKKKLRTPISEGGSWMGY